MIATPPMSPTMKTIRREQSRESILVGSVRPENPDTLLIACIDARINPKDIGIQNALIYRTIAALVPDPGDEDNMAKALDYAINKRGIKHIVIMGHTLCGGLKACCTHGDEKLPAVKAHLSSIHDVRDTINGTHKGDEHLDERLHALEDESVRESLRHLMSYPIVRDAMAREDESKRVDVRGWVIDTAKRDIRETDEKLGEFRELVRMVSAEKPSDTIDAVRCFTPPPRREGEDPTIHKPEMLLLGDMDANYNPSPEYGKALIHRDLFRADGSLSKSKKAAIEFAVKGMGESMRDIVIMAHTDSDMFDGIANPDEKLTPDQRRTLNEEMLKNQYRVLSEYLNQQNLALNQQNLATPNIRLHGWLFDAATKRISELDGERFVPLQQGTKPDGAGGGIVIG